MAAQEKSRPPDPDRSLVMFACVMLAVVALLNVQLASDELDEVGGAPRTLFDLRLVT